MFGFREHQCTNKNEVRNIFHVLKKEIYLPHSSEKLWNAVLSVSHMVCVKWRKGNYINILYVLSRLIFYFWTNFRFGKIFFWWWTIFNLFYWLRPDTFHSLLESSSRAPASLHLRTKMIETTTATTKKDNNLDLRSKISFCWKQMVHLSLFICLFIYSFWQFPDSLWDCIYSIRINCSTRMFYTEVISVPVVLFPSSFSGTEWREWDWYYNNNSKKVYIDGTIRRLK